MGSISATCHSAMRNSRQVSFHPRAQESDTPRKFLTILTRIPVIRLSPTSVMPSSPPSNGGRVSLPRRAKTQAIIKIASCLIPQTGALNIAPRTSDPSRPATGRSLKRKVARMSDRQLKSEGRKLRRKFDEYEGRGALADALGGEAIRRERGRARSKSNASRRTRSQQRSLERHWEMLKEDDDDQEEMEC